MSTSSPQPAGGDVDSDKFIICAKFRRDCRITGSNNSWWRRGSKDAGGSEESRKNSASGVEQTSTEEDYGALEDDRFDDHVLIVMKMLDDCGKFPHYGMQPSHILKVAQHTIISCAYYIDMSRHPPLFYRKRIDECGLHDGGLTLRFPLRPVLAMALLQALQNVQSVHHPLTHQHPCDLYVIRNGGGILHDVLGAQA